MDTKTKHQPATPLPWSIDSNSSFERTQIVSGNTRIMHAPTTINFPIGNLKFAVHAANAYPKLVAALRAYRITYPLDAYADTTETLLRELGEA